MSQCDKCKTLFLRDYDPCPVCQLQAELEKEKCRPDYPYEDIQKFKDDIKRLTEDKQELHRRCQKAEAANQVTIDDCKRQGVSIGRSLANAGYLKLESEIKRLEKENGQLKLDLIEQIGLCDKCGERTGQ